MALFFLSALLFFCDACAKTPSSDVEENTFIIATVNDEVILMEELLAYTDDFFASTGAERSAYTREELYEVYDLLLENLISQTVELQKAEALGYTALSEADQALLAESFQSEISERYAYFYEVAQSENPGAKEEDLRTYTDSLVSQYVEETGETDEYLKATMAKTIALDNMFYDLTADVPLDEADIKVEYEKRVAEDRETYEKNPSWFESDKTTNDVYYNLPGYRYVKHIVCSVRSTIEEVAQKVATEDFEALIEAYSEDTSTTNRSRGYVVGPGSAQYAEVFTQAALSLEKPGDVSGIIEAPDGYHIIKYIFEIPEGPEKYEDMHDALYEELLLNNKNTAYNAYIEEWISQSDITIYRELYDRY